MDHVTYTAENSQFYLDHVLILLPSTIFKVCITEINSATKSLKIRQMCFLWAANSAKAWKKRAQYVHTKTIKMQWHQKNPFKQLKYYSKTRDTLPVFTLLPHHPIHPIPCQFVLHECSFHIIQFFQYHVSLTLMNADCPNCSADGPCPGLTGRLQVTEWNDSLVTPSTELRA